MSPAGVTAIQGAAGTAKTRTVLTTYARAAYVAISRARTSAILYTDSRASLTEALGLRDGAQVGAIDELSWGETSALWEFDDALMTSRCSNLRFEL